MNKAQAMLNALRSSYLTDLPSHIDELESLLLNLESNGFDAEMCSEVYRRIHSLKGSGGTYGLHVISDVCHPFEDLISHFLEHPELLHQGFMTSALGYIDLLRKVTAMYQDTKNPGEDIQEKLQTLRHQSLQSPFSALVVESSDVVLNIIKDVLKTYGFRLEVAKDGYLALGRILSEPFDLVVTSLETPRMNGMALISAAQRLGRKSKNTTCVLITASQLKQDENMPDYVLQKDATFRESFNKIVHHVIVS
ncbi:Hpt domain-containing protein [Undibacterium sp. RuRC25W]|uniref:response regulator n=1 Tax=Undibacterium sp. RuRC25W TaxID=3413047 RepID=UPI003BEFEB06